MVLMVIVISMMNCLVVLKIVFARLPTMRHSEIEAVRTLILDGDLISRCPIRNLGQENTVPMIVHSSLWTTLILLLDTNTMMFTDGREIEGKFKNRGLTNECQFFPKNHDPGLNSYTSVSKRN